MRSEKLIHSVTLTGFLKGFRKDSHWARQTVKLTRLVKRRVIPKDFQITKHLAKPKGLLILMAILKVTHWEIRTAMPILTDWLTDLQTGMLKERRFHLVKRLEIRWGFLKEMLTHWDWLMVIRKEIQKDWQIR